VRASETSGKDHNSRQNVGIHLRRADVFSAPTLEQLATWLQEPEDEHLEFKQAKRRYDFDELVRCCAALANEGGGRGPAWFP